MELLIIFIVLNIVNVVLQTIKSLATVKCGKWMASVINAVAYGLYTLVLIYTANDELERWCKVIIVAATNLVGVFVVKLVEEKSHKTKLWKVEATVPNAEFEKYRLDELTIPHNYIDIGNYKIVNFYCNTKEASRNVKCYLDLCHAKYFVSESKIL